MPVLEPLNYRPGRFFNSGHWQTIYPALLRRPRVPAPERVLLTTADGDRLEVDWYRSGHGRAVIISHGLEGSSRAGYVRAMVAALLSAGWDCIAWSFRGCGREPNLLPRFYHSGETGDLREVIARFAPDYRMLALVGFSLGGNITLKYLGEAPETVEPKILAAATFSVPCDLAAAARQLSRLSNRIYTWRFLKSLRRKVRLKAVRFPDRFDIRGLEKVRTFHAFDDRYTAPIHGFRDAEDYWRRCSSRPLLSSIRLPTLLVNARNDPFLPDECFPFAEAAASDTFFFEAPPGGGHVGFANWHPRQPGWAETRAVKFLEEWARCCPGNPDT